MAKEQTFDALVLYRDQRKNVFHGVISYSFSDTAISVEFEKHDLKAVIPLDAIIYFGPPEPFGEREYC